MNRYIKKEAKKRLIEGYLYHYVDRIEKNINYDGWESVFSESEIVAIVSEDVGSCSMLCYFLPMLEKNVKICGIYQATYDYVNRAIGKYRVENLHRISEIEKSHLFLVFDSAKYNGIYTLLKEIGVNKICCVQQLEKVSAITLFWGRRKYCRKIYAPLAFAYIENGFYKNSDANWNDFQKKLKGKHLFLFGAGRGCDDYLASYYEKFKVEGIIDNERFRWGQEIKGIKICGINEICKYENEEVVILITTLRYDDIVQQLMEIGYTNTVALWEMEAKKVKYFVLRPYYYARKKRSHILMSMASLFLPVNKKKIMFIRHNGKGFGCHEKYIAEEILRNTDRYKIVWMLNDPFEVLPSGIIREYNTLENRIFHLATSKLWFDDGLKEWWVRKKASQRFICTQHGTGITLKRVGLDEKGVNRDDFLKVLKHNENISDVWLSASKMIADDYRTAYNYGGEVMITGSPRVDILINKSTDGIRSIRDKLGLNNDQKLLLYAPTFIRNNSEKHGNKLFDLDLPRLCKRLEKKYGYEYIAGVRLHPLDKGWGQLQMDGQSVRLRNYTFYPDPQELLLAADILITDYSSIMFDMGYAKKKVVLFVPELDEYIRNERGMHFDLKELPFPVAFSAEQIYSTIVNMDEKDYLDGVRKFNEQCGVLEDGKASRRVYELVLSYMR